MGKILIKDLLVMLPDVEMDGFVNIDGQLQLIWLNSQILLPEPELKIGKSKKVLLDFPEETKDFSLWEISTMSNSTLVFRMGTIVTSYMIKQKITVSGGNARFNKAQS